MSDRRGFSLVEMVIVLVLAGIVSTAAVTMFATQNKLNAQMTALGESQENARSAVLLAASELHGATPAAVLEAGRDTLTLRLPVVLGIVCGESESADAPGNSALARENRPFKHIYVPLDGLELRDEVIDGYAVMSSAGVWDFPQQAYRGNVTRGAGMSGCAPQGATSDDPAEYLTLNLGRGYGPGTPVMLYRVVSYYFARSALDGSRRGFFRASTGQAVELAHGFTTDSRFEFQLVDTAWSSSVARADLGGIEAVRIVADVTGVGTSGAASGSASFQLVREVQLRNVQ